MAKEKINVDYYCDDKENCPRQSKCFVVTQEGKMRFLSVCENLSIEAE